MYFKSIPDSVPAMGWKCFVKQVLLPSIFYRAFQPSEHPLEGQAKSVADKHEVAWLDTTIIPIVSDPRYHVQSSHRVVRMS